MITCFSEILCQKQHTHIYYVYVRLWMNQERHNLTVLMVSFIMEEVIGICISVDAMNVHNFPCIHACHFFFSFLHSNGCISWFDSNENISFCHCSCQIIKWIELVREYVGVWSSRLRKIKGMEMICDVLHTNAKQNKYFC